MRDQWNHKIFEVNSDDFESLALEAYHFQLNNNETYRHFVRALGKENNKISSLREIPFLPVSFFKTHVVVLDGLMALSAILMLLPRI